MRPLDSRVHLAVVVGLSVLISVSTLQCKPRDDTSHAARADSTTNDGKPTPAPSSGGAGDDAVGRDAAAQRGVEPANLARSAPTAGAGMVDETDGSLSGDLHSDSLDVANDVDDADTSEDGVLPVASTGSRDALLRLMRDEVGTRFGVPEEREVLVERLQTAPHLTSPHLAGAFKDIVETLPPEGSLAGSCKACHTELRLEHLEAVLGQGARR